MSRKAGAVCLPGARNECRAWTCPPARPRFESPGTGSTGDIVVDGDDIIGDR